MTTAQVILASALILIFATIIWMALSFFCVTFYIHWKRRVPEKFHYTNNKSNYTFSVDESELDAPPSKSVDGASAMDGFTKK